MYTLDASAPSEINGKKYTTPILINKTTILRAMAYKDNMDPSCISTQTYIFPEDIKNQSGPTGREWPKDSVNGQVMDYEMDPCITDHKDYSTLMTDSLLYIPSISLATDLQHLFDTRTGIYANPFGRGDEWERPVSVELIYPAHFKVTGMYEGYLSNNGETLLLESPAGKEIISITYSNTDPWPASADGEGYSLEMPDLELPVNDGGNWTASRQLHGSPGF